MVITVYDGTTLLGTATLDGSGGWSFTPTTPLTDGPAFADDPCHRCRRGYLDSLIRSSW